MNIREREALKKVILKLAGKDNKHGFFSANTLEDCRDEAETDWRRLNPDKELDLEAIERMARAAYEKGMGECLPNFYISNGHFAVIGPLFSPEEIKVLFPPPELRRRRLSAKAFEDIFPSKAKYPFRKTNMTLHVEEFPIRVFYNEEHRQAFYLDEKYLPIVELLAPGGELLADGNGSLSVDDGEGFRLMVMGIQGYGSLARDLIKGEFPGMLPEEDE